MRHPDPQFGYPTASWRARAETTTLTPSSARHGFLRQGTQVLDTHLDAIDLDSAAQRIIAWGSRHQSRIVTLCSATTLVQAAQDPALQRAIAQADLALPGDASVAWVMRSEGQRCQRAIAARDLMWRHLALAEQAGLAVHCHGGSEASVDRLMASIRDAFPHLQVSGTPRTTDDQALAQRIHASGAQFVLLGLEHPDQEAWMSTHRSQVQAVMIGLGPDFGQPEAIGSEARTWRSQRLRWGRRLTFFSRVLLNLVLGTPPSGHDELR